MTAARLSPGAISVSSSSHLPPSEGSKRAKPVMFPPGRSSRATMPLATGSATVAKTIGIVRVSRWTATVAGVAPVRMKFLCEHSYLIDVVTVPPKVDPQVAAIGPTQARKRFRERRDVSLPIRIGFVVWHERADTPHAFALLRPRRKGPRRCTPEPCNELPPPHP